MAMRSNLRRVLRDPLKRFPAVWQRVVSLDTGIERARHSLAAYLPVLVRPEPRHLEIAITAHCNLRCVGCRYGREFMPGSELPWDTVRDLLDDAREAGFWDVRFYGGEPLLHRALPRMVEHASSLGLGVYVTTNGILLKQRIDELFRAGLRTVNIGFYGTGHRYDAYVQRRERFRELEAGLDALRERCGSEVRLRINWLLMRPSCNVEDLHRAWAFAERYDARFQVDLVHYSLPYFTEGPDRMLQFRPDDRPAIETVVAELVRLKQAHPERFNQSLPGLRSIPDWLLRGPGMRVPCDSHQMIWVGADGTVQQCYVTYHLGNLHEQRLRQMLHTPAHRAHARDSFALGCPNCHCHYDGRINKHAPSLRTYAAGAPAPTDAAREPMPRPLPVLGAVPH
jgi:molybdenum cofactor biosynthesis enzyme MoaA